MVDVLIVLLEILAALVLSAIGCAGIYRAVDAELLRRRFAREGFDEPGLLFGALMWGLAGLLLLFASVLVWADLLK